MSLLHRIHRSHPRRLALALAAAGLLLAGLTFVDRRGVGGTAVSIADPTFDPLLDGAAASVCGPIGGAALKVPAAWLHAVATVTKTETAPFQPQPMKAAGGDVPLYTGLGSLAFPITTRNAQAQAYFNQGMRLSFAFNHAEAQRAFHVAQKADPNCAACFWGEALILGPNINVPMMPEANAPAVAALEKAVALKDRAGPKERGVDRSAAAALLGRSEGRAAGARRGVCRCDAEGRRALSGRRHDPHAVRRSRDGHAAVGLLGARRRQAEGPRRRDRLEPRDGPQAQPEARRRDPPLHPCGRGVEHAGARAGAGRAARRADAGSRATWCTCRRTSTTASASTVARSTPTSWR
jgi:hypothetical protein